MTENKGKETPQSEAAEDQDVEGHSMVINPTIASELARSRSKELEREAREHRRAKEAKEARR